MDENLSFKYFSARWSTGTKSPFCKSLAKHHRNWDSSGMARKLSWPQSYWATLISFKTKSCSSALHISRWPQKCNRACLGNGNKPGILQSYDRFNAQANRSVFGQQGSYKVLIATSGNILYFVLNFWYIATRVKEHVTGKPAPSEIALHKHVASEASSQL